MKPFCTLGLAAFLMGGLATAALAATGANENSAGQTTTSTSPTMSSPNVPSHDGNSQLGYTTSKAAPGAANNPGAAASPHTGYSAGVNPNAGTPSGTNDGTDDTGATSPGSSDSHAYGSRQATQTGSATQKMRRDGLP